MSDNTDKDSASLPGARRAAYADLVTLVPFKRIGEPDGTAQPAVRLGSDASDCVTGATLSVDGGMTLHPGFATNG